jgi:hypothetical protein
MIAAARDRFAVGANLSRAAAIIRKYLRKESAA